MYTVELTKLVDKMKLVNLTPEIDITPILLNQPEVNRPALQLAGFFDYFNYDRVQIIGNVEYAYMEKMEKDHGSGIMRKLMSHKIPCIVFCRNLPVREELLKLAVEYNVPIFQTAKSTSDFMGEVIRWLKVELAPRISIHGVLVDVYGEGILITGESGIGKSEAALELIKRGHRLVSDDVVEIKKVSDDTLIGSAPDITRHFIELRGIGIVDVKALFGVESVKNTQSIDLTSTIPMPRSSIKCLVISGAEPIRVSSLTFLISTTSSDTRRCPLLINSKAASLLPIPLSPVIKIPSP